MTDILIIGAGMAGLSAALELKRQGAGFRILEAAVQPGGRAATLVTPSGTPVDLGAHWLHGEKTPLGPLVKSYGIRTRRDTADNLTIFEGGETRKADGEWLDDLLDHEKAEGVKSGALPDCPLPDLARDEKGRKILSEFGLMWNGVDTPLYPSAREFLTDENTIGGLQLEGGIGALIARMAQEAGNIRYGALVSDILVRDDGVEVRGPHGDSWLGSHVIFTGSLGVLKSGAINFFQPLEKDFRHALDHFVMGEMNKIVAEVDPVFFAARGIANDTALELLDGAPPHFCHVRSGGLPLISLYVTGRQARLVEAMGGAEALGYLRTVLSPVKALEGFEDQMVGEIVVSRWSGNPLSHGAYSCCLPGGVRTGPYRQGRLVVCGDTFDTRFPSSLAGAFRSGQAAAGLIA